MVLAIQAVKLGETDILPIWSGIEEPLSTDLISYSMVTNDISICSLGPLVENTKRIINES